MRRLVVMLVALAACSGGDNSTGPVNRTTFSFTDPAGDTLGSSAFRNHDLRTTSGYISDDSLSITLEFAGAISRGSLGVANSLYGFVELDVDENPNTGYLPTTDSYREETGLGVEFVIVLGEDNEGTEVILYDIDANVDYVIPARFESNRVTVRVALSMIDVADGRLAMVGVVGNDDAATDVLPNTGVYQLRLTTTAASLAPPTGTRAILPRAAGRVNSAWERAASR